ncbi:MAG TPA: DUF2202 domain-containing protein, partial [Sphaerochaeta sp.]|nr:DUF2202 domain-containing protein [Sphaerochaeta sp.]
MNFKHKHFYKAVAIAALMGIVATAFLSAQPINEEQSLPTAVAIGEEAPSQAEGILYMREEEKLARDVYLAMYDAWGIRAFANIARA